MATEIVSNNLGGGLRGSLKRRCAECSAGDTSRALLLCTGCRVVRYCSKGHQVEHRTQHKHVCSRVKRSRQKLEAEEHQVRNATPDFMTPANAFETDVGHFWGLHHTRPYVRARFALLDLLRKEGSLDGVKEALSHLMDMMRLCPSDNMGLRDMIPAVMLQLNHDQDCYDFIKWYATAGQDPHYDWGNTDLPFLDVRNADVHEQLNYIKRKHGDPHHLAALILLKFKLLQDNVNIRLVRKVSTAATSKLHQELWDHIENAVIRSPLSAQFHKYSSVELEAMGFKLGRHIKILGARLREANESVIFGLLRPDQWLGKHSEAYSPGSPEEMQLVLDYSYQAWWQTEEALKLLENSRKNAEKDMANEIEDMMKSSSFQHKRGPPKSAAEFLDDVSFNCIWGYIDWAVEDAVSLASERPSDVHRRTSRELWNAAQEEHEDFDSSDENGDEIDDGYERE